MRPTKNKTICVKEEDHRAGALIEATRGCPSARSAGEAPERGWRAHEHGLCVPCSDGRISPCVAGECQVRPRAIRKKKKKSPSRERHRSHTCPDLPRARMPHLPSSPQNITGALRAPPLGLSSSNLVGH
ncbi:hypothetical protein FQA47_012689 [Oryzias melastigma]|uniref:Uncharacterized protein n=1 Tax=Oryzias melastigma TaxID=30732 RepID=A0A834FHE0_ORYME|nr:hypothetical protein FQA47_012689 [Oryzias melastigma]